MEDVYLEQVHTFGSIDRHPSGRVITTAYYSLIDVKHHKLRLNHNDLHWHPIKSISKLAFDHKIIVDTCLERLREQVMEHPVIFNLLPDKFSLRELQELYQAILAVDLDRRNFRKKIAIKDWLVDLNEMEQDVPHRPGKLYTLKPEFKRTVNRQSDAGQDVAYFMKSMPDRFYMSEIEFLNRSNNNYIDLPSTNLEGSIIEREKVCPPR